MVYDSEGEVITYEFPRDEFFYGLRLARARSIAEDPYKEERKKFERTKKLHKDDTLERLIVTD